MKRKYVVLQEEISDCGVCSLLSIIKYYKGYIPLEELRINSLTDNKGVTAYNLIECAKKYGFQSEGVKVNNLESENLPCIAHLNINKSLTHFVSVYKISNNKIFYMDPSVGYISESILEFYKKFTGIVIRLKPRTVIVKKEVKKVIQKLMCSEIKKHYKQFIIILFINITLVLTTIICSLFYNNIFENIFIITMLLLVGNVIISVLKYLIDTKIEKLVSKVEQNIMNSYFEKLLQLPLYYMQLKGTGEIQKRVTDIENIIDISLKSNLKIILNTIIILISSIMIFIIKKELFILIFIYLLSVLIITKKYSAKINKRINEDIYNQTNYNQILVETISGIKSINYSNSRLYFKERLTYTKKSSNLSSLLLKKDICKYNIFISIIYIIINLIINIYLLIEIKNRNILIEYYFVINGIFNFLIEAIIETISLYPNLSYKNKIINKVNEFLSIESKQNLNQSIDDYTITLNKVSFTYNSLDKVLNNVSLKIEKGEKIFFKGNNGAGKSTLFKLLIKDLESYEGEILIGKKEISTLSKDEICNYISYIYQDEKIFSMTIKENILLGLECEEDLDKIIKICELDKLLNKMPFGLNTFLIGGGEELSAGEKELIILARHLIRNNKIIIIDEATSHIANHLENKIIKNILDLYQDKTIIFISHRNKEYLFKRTIKLR